MALPVTISGLSTTIAIVGPFKSTHSPSIATADTVGSNGDWGDNISHQIGQTFTVGSTALACTLIRFQLTKVGTPADNISCSIYAVDGGGMPTGSSLATSTNTISGGSLSTTPTYQTASFTFTEIALSASTQYAAVLSRSGAQSGTNYYQIGIGTLSSYTGGTGILLDGSSTWGDWGNDFVVAVSGATAYYFFGRDSTTSTTLQAYKATDPTNSWSSIATNTGFTTAVQNISGRQNGDTIHLAVIDGSGSSVNLKYRTFNMAADAFETSETVHSAFDPRDSLLTNIYASSIVFRSSDSQPIILYSGPRVASMGTSYARIVYALRTGTATWTTNVAVDGGSTIDWIYPEAVIGGSDRSHFFWWQRTNVLINQRSLTSANVLQTTGTAGNFAGLPNNMGLSAISYDSSGTYKVACATIDNTGTAFGTVFFNSANDPTEAAGTEYTATIGPVRLYNDGTDMWALYADNSATPDLYVRESTDNGSTFGSATLAFNATITTFYYSLSIDGNVYQRGNDYVIPYVANDNGTLKYNEYVIRTTVTTPWADMSGSSMLMPVKHNTREVVGY